MNKRELVHKIINLLRIEADNLAGAAKTAHADATNPESKAENKYDTRGQEASYLAGAQAHMASNALQNLAAYQTIELKEFTSQSRIALTALVELESDGRSSLYFLGPKGGGTEIEYNGSKVLLITPSSPLGKKLIGHQVGDYIVMHTDSGQKEYEVISIS